MLKETFIKRHIVERTNKAEVRPEEQSEKTESYRENIYVCVERERGRERESGRKGEGPNES